MKTDNRVRITLNIKSSAYISEEFEKIILARIKYLVNELKTDGFIIRTDKEIIEYTKPTKRNIEELINLLKRQSYEVKFPKNKYKDSVTLSTIKRTIKEYFET